MAESSITITMANTLGMVLTSERDLSEGGSLGRVESMLSYMRNLTLTPSVIFCLTTWACDSRRCSTIRSILFLAVPRISLARFRLGTVSVHRTAFDSSPYLVRNSGGSRVVWRPIRCSLYLEMK